MKTDAIFVLIVPKGEKHCSGGPISALAVALGILSSNKCLMGHSRLTRQRRRRVSQANVALRAGALAVLPGDVGPLGAVRERYGMGGLWLRPGPPAGTGGSRRSGIPRLEGCPRGRQSWWTARLHSLRQVPPMTVVSLSRSTTRTARADPQPQRISWNWLASGSGRYGRLACRVQLTK